MADTQPSGLARAQESDLLVRVQQVTGGTLLLWSESL